MDPTVTPFHALVPNVFNREPGLILSSSRGLIHFWDGLGMGLAGGQHYSVTDLNLEEGESVTTLTRAAVCLTARICEIYKNLMALCRFSHTSSPPLMVVCSTLLSLQPVGSISFPLVRLVDPNLLFLLHVSCRVSGHRKPFNQAVETSTPSRYLKTIEILPMICGLSSTCVCKNGRCRRKAGRSLSQTTTFLDPFGMFCVLLLRLPL